MPHPLVASAERRRRRRALVERLGAGQHGVVHRADLYAAGISRGEVRAQVRAGRWRRLGCHAIATFTGPLTTSARHWAAVIEGGPRAMLDGESSLLVAGLQHYDVRLIRVTVPRGARIRHRTTSVDIRQTRRWHHDDHESTSPIPRTRTPVAAVRAALWARSDKQATLLLTMTVQQGLATADEIGAALLAVRRDKRRLLLHAAVLDLLGGVGSLHEQAVLHGCRRRRLPEPDAQVLRRTQRGTRGCADVIRICRPGRHLV